MSKLTTSQRNNLPDSKFAGTGRSYPIDTKTRAANAKARATQMVDTGKLSPASAVKIRAKANKVLNDGSALSKKMRERV
jgi:hypothetical protein